MLMGTASARLKAFLIAISLVLYVYIILLTRSWFVKRHELDRMYESVNDMRRQMAGIHKLDRSLVRELEVFDGFREQFY